MKILIDIGHPAHIHYFKHFAKKMVQNGHDIFFTVRDRESTLELMEGLNFNYEKRGKGGSSLLTKVLLMPFIDLKIFICALKFKPDLFLSFASPYAAHVSKIMNKPHIAFDDTEHAVWAHKLYRPFSNVVLSPSCYLNSISPNQLLFNSYMELSHLHPDNFIPNKQVLDQLGINSDEKYVVLRFISWNANHDVGQRGFSVEEKIHLVEKLSESCKIFISSEGDLPEKLRQYRLEINPSDFHDLLAFASLYIGEGATTAAESAVLGVPAIYVNSLKVGYCTELEERYGLVYSLNNIDQIIHQSLEILGDSESKDVFENKMKEMLKEKINPTKFMVWFVEKWPESKQIMKEDPDFQSKFK